MASRGKGLHENRARRTGRRGTRRVFQRRHTDHTHLRDRRRELLRRRAHIGTGGTVVFGVQNTGSEVMDFYPRRGRPDRGELQGVGPGEARDPVVEVPSGAYTTACVPGASGRGHPRWLHQVETSDR